MPPLKRFTQKRMFEIRYAVRPSGLSRAQLVADKWITDLPEYETDTLRLRVRNTEHHQVVQMSHTNAVMDVEGPMDLAQFSGLACRLSSDVAQIIEPPKITRLGFRIFHLITGITTERARAAISAAFLPKLSNWAIDTNGRDSVSDLALILEFNEKPPFLGRVQFGPYVQANRASFMFPDERTIRDVKDGFLFDCDVGEQDMSIGSLNKESVTGWIRHANDISQDRIRSIMEAMGVAE